MFLRDYWYVAAWSDEVGRALLSRRILGEDIVLYRKADGGVVALADRCAHRHLPLSQGVLDGDILQCGYHGLAYDSSGTCVRIPGQDAPSNYCVKAYPVVERHQFIMVWMGDAAAPDYGRLISFERMLHPAWATTKVRLHIRANYLLVVDNLMDLSHVAYVHHSTIGNAAVAEEADVVFSRSGTTVRAARNMCGVPAARTYAEFGPHKGIFDRWQISEFYPPSYFFINNGSGRCGWEPDGGGDRLMTQGEWGFQVFHGITPESETTTHQFWGLAHENAAVPPEGRAEFYRQAHLVVMEDLAVYEAQQISLDSDLQGASAENVRSAAVINADRGLLHARKIIRDLKEAEVRVGALS